MTGFFIEMFLTFQLVLVIFMAAVETHNATFLAPVAIGLTLFVAHLSAIYYTGSSLNPARSFGPDLVSGQFPSYHWIYCIINLLYYAHFPRAWTTCRSADCNGDIQTPEMGPV